MGTVVTGAGKLETTQKSSASVSSAPAQKALIRVPPALQEWLAASKD